ncbi:MAG: hypothetical protein K0R15_129 [Clostridiales bacterium]|jgi:putative ABC transport system permease protein|nr:hypothetical protein [Clostridiales bacterium]
MNKIWMLSLSNIRKSKGASFSLLIVITIAAILLSLGLLTSLNFKKAFDNRAAELNSAHVAAAMNYGSYQEQFDTYFSTYTGVIDTQKEEIIFLSSAKYAYGSGELAFPAFFINTSKAKELSPLTLAEKLDEVSGRDIYVPYILQSGGGYELSDEFIINYRDKDYSFRIAGFTEDILLGSTNLGGVGFHLPEESYINFQNELNDDTTNGILLQSRLDNTNKSDEMITNFQKNVILKGQEGIASSVWLCSYSAAKNIRTQTATIGATIIIAFSLIIVLVSLLVIKFRVNTSIEDGMADIGALKSLGYTSHQIISSIVLQFMLIAFTGAIAGILVSYLGVVPLSNMFSAQTGLIWKQGLDLQSSALCFILILFSVVIITPFSARRIKKLHPIIALRCGATTHTFKKNHCPLDRTKGSLNFVLSLKNILANVKQNIMIVIIVSAVCFASVFGLVMYYNIVINDKAFIDMVGVEMCSIALSTVEGVDTAPLIENIKKMDGVRKAFNYNYGSVTINDESVQAYISDDLALLDNNQIYEGRYPKYNNEISINGSMAKKYEKSVGDTILVKFGSNEIEYLITGLSQGMSFMGRDITITLDGVKQMKESYQYNSINIYLEDDIDVKNFISELNQRYGTKITASINMKDMASSQLGAYSSIVAIIASIILIITGFVVVLILYLVIKAVLIRFRKDFGIQKAIGFTTFQLMTQTTLSFLPVVFIGAILGSLIGSIYINTLISILFKEMGVMKVSFIVPTLWIGLMCFGICVISYVVSMLVSWRIRKISAYLLMVE